MLKRTTACLAVLFLAGLATHALTLLLLTEEQMAQQSDRIVLGDVLSTRTAWMDPEGDGEENIYTIATFRIEQTIKGPDQPGTDLTLHMYGGTIGDLTQGVGGVTPFAANEKLILCLEPNLDRVKLSPIVGVTQGRWVVRTDSQGNRFARRELADAAFMVRNVRGELQPATAPLTGEEPLETVLSRLKSEAQK